MSDLNVPTHVGFIVDGNRRWAKQHGLPVYEGHLAGYNAIQEVATEAFEAGVKFVSVYVFSTENWKRDEDEIKRIMSLVLRMMTADLHIFLENDIKMKIIGSRDRMDKKLIAAIDDAEARTSRGKRGTLVLCVNYGGQQEITDAVKKIVQSGVKADEVDVNLVSENIYEPEVPPLDLVVRTSGENRISNFMLWRIAYSELLFLNKMWPDMRKEDVNYILEEYSKRNRRIGK